MSESDKPIFPRQPENSDEFNEKAEKALENLVKEEKYTTDKGRIIFCPSCFQRINFEDIFCPHCGSVTDSNYKQEKPIPMSPNVFPVEYGPPPIDLMEEISEVYGPPPMNLRDREKFPVTPAYGPPPISIFNYKLWLILIPVFLVIMILIAVIGILILRSHA